MDSGRGGMIALLFTDLVSSTELLQRLGDDAAEDLRRDHFGLLRAAVSAGGGREVKNLGDGLMVTFPSSVQAVSCAVAMQRAIAEHNEADPARAFQIRIGVHLGEPVADEDDFFGTAVVVAKRLCDRAAGEQILASELVAGVVGSRGGHRFTPVGPLKLKGLAEPLPAVSVEWNPAGTECNVEGPVYIAGAPELTAPYVLPQRPDEPGEKLVFSGTVRGTDGAPLAAAELDVWQANGAGEYSHFNPGVPDHNLRGKLRTDAAGRFEFATVVPSEYPIPLAGATGRLLATLGRPGIRPAHIHFKISHPAAAPLTTQIYFADDPYLHTDVVGATKPSLAVATRHHADDHGRRWATCTFDFVLTTG